jgi:DMSO/TMAO reductase YedYZ molybdopterin-dependent catalytic subunit
VSLFIVQNVPKPSPTPTTSPSTTEASPTPTGTTPIPTIPYTPTPPLQTPTPTPIPTTSPAPTEISPTPTGTPVSTPTFLSTPTPPSTSSLYPGEVSQYLGQSLTPVAVFVQEIVQHPDVAIHGTQYIDQETYRLTVTGLVNNTLEYSYDDVISNFQSYPEVATLLCVEGWSVTMLWEGVSVNDLIKEAGVNPTATTVIFHASDGYTTALPIDYIVQNNLILAYKINNVTLPVSIGWPFTLVAKNQYGYKWINWVTEIDVSSDSSYLGYWESRGYPNDATLRGNPSNAVLHVDPNNAALPGDISPVAYAIIVSVGAIVIAVVIYIILMKPRTKQPKTLEQ